MELTDKIVDWIEENKIFLRHRKSNNHRALGMLLYRSGLSHRMTEHFVGASYEAGRKWYLKGRQLFADQQVVKERKQIAVDEKEISVGRKKMCVWIAVDLNDERVIGVYTSQVRNYILARSFLKRVAKLCKGKLPKVFVDGGRYYPWALKRLGFKYTVVAFGPRSSVERFLSLIDWRIKRFWEKFTSKSTPTNLLGWMEAFVGFTNYWREWC